MIKKTLTCLSSELTDVVVGLMSTKNDELMKGIVAIVSEDNKLIGSFADGDLRRIISEDSDLNLPVINYMVNDPICIKDTDLNNSIAWSNIEKLEDKLTRKVKNIFVLNKYDQLIGMIDRHHYQINNQNLNFQDCCIMGLGFVGLTVACHISANNIKVIGLDSSRSLINDLKNKKTKFDEPGLLNMMSDSLDMKLLEFTHEIPKSMVYMIAVGSPISDQGVPDISQILSCLDKISTVLTPGVLIIIRSTIPLGSCREIFIPYLENLIGMKCGIDWHLSFAPERTLEGSALQELRNLPQIISGFSDACLKKSSEFFDKFCNNTVEVESLESAEMAKLACNTYRDLKFSFANELSSICEQYNINSRKLISKINFDYERAGIPLPSPGVGGYCLTKDPIIYTHPSRKPSIPIELGRVSRKINEYAAQSPNRVLKSFCSKFNYHMEDINILIIGLAFKGSPETNDIRFSTSLDFFHSIKSSVSNIYGFDNCIGQNEIVSYGFEPNFNIKKIDQYNISGIFFLNNHIKNSNINLMPWLNTDKPKFVFDGWGCREDLEELDINDFKYTTLGMLDF